MFKKPFSSSNLVKKIKSISDVPFHGSKLFLSDSDVTRDRLLTDFIAKNLHSRDSIFIVESNTLKSILPRLSADIALLDNDFSVSPYESVIDFLREHNPIDKELSWNNFLDIYTLTVFSGLECDTICIDDFLAFEVSFNVLINHFSLEFETVRDCLDNFKPKDMEKYQNLYELEFARINKNELPFSTLCNSFDSFRKAMHIFWTLPDWGDMQNDIGYKCPSIFTYIRGNSESIKVCRIAYMVFANKVQRVFSSNHLHSEITSKSHENLCLLVDDLNLLTPDDIHMLLPLSRSLRINMLFGVTSNSDLQCDKESRLTYDYVFANQVGVFFPNSKSIRVDTSAFGVDDSFSSTLKRIILSSNNLDFLSGDNTFIYAPLITTTNLQSDFYHFDLGE